ncbi:MAG: hypothetical protein ACO1SV_26915 [Fimbriimonas sp.]
MQTTRNGWLGSRTMAMLAVSALALPILAGCGSGGAGDSRPAGANMPPIDDSRAMRYGNPGGTYGQQQPPSARRGMSTGTKMAILAGAAALYYMYKKNQEKKAAGQLNGQPVYYLSKNGRVYYRDASGQAHWVTPPPQGIQVPADEALMYRDFQGYNNNPYGTTLEQLGAR